MHTMIKALSEGQKECNVQYLTQFSPLSILQGIVFSRLDSRNVLRMHYSRTVICLRYGQWIRYLSRTVDVLVSF